MGALTVLDDWVFFLGDVFCPVLHNHHPHLYHVLFFFFGGGGGGDRLKAKTLPSLLRAPGHLEGLPTAPSTPGFRV